jgi:hypothetical protein
MTTILLIIASIFMLPVAVWTIWLFSVISIGIIFQVFDFWARLVLWVDDRA